MKRCNQCREMLPLDAFHRRRASRDGRQYSCRECTRPGSTRLRRGVRVPFPRSLFDRTDRQIAERFGVSRRTVVRWGTEGLPAHRMDEIADQLGLHPTEIWDCYYEVAA